MLEDAETHVRSPSLYITSMKFYVTSNCQSAISVVSEAATLLQSALDAHVEVKHPKEKITTETSNTKTRTDSSPVFRHRCRQASRTAV